MSSRFMTAENIKGITRMIKNRGMGNSIGQMTATIKESGRMESSMDKASILLMVILSIKVFGWKECSNI